MKNFRLLRADEIECRVSRVTEKGVMLLLYKTARTDADLLDESVGPENWVNDFKVVDGTLYGGIGVDYGRGYVWKWDAGTESNTEAEKGRASDAFKRAGFKHGIGRELYSAPFVFIPAGKCNISGGKCYDKFEVGSIEYDDMERISGLVITLDGKRVFEWGGSIPAKAPEKAPARDPAKAPKVKYYCEECGAEILDGKARDGSAWPAENIAKYAKARYDRQLCVDCMKKAEKK